MFDKEKRKGIPERRLRDLIAGIAIGVVGVLVILGLIAHSQCWFRVGCNSLPPLPTATTFPTITPSNTPTSTPTVIPSFTPVPSLTPTIAATSRATATALPAPTKTPVSGLYEPYELRAFAVNPNHTLIALSYWDETQGILEAWPWLDKHVGDRSVIGIVGTERPYERLMFSPRLDSNTLIAWPQQDNNAELIYFGLQDRSIMPNYPTFYSPDGRWYAQVASGQLVLYDGQTAVAQLTLEGIYDSMAFSPQSDTLAVVSRDGDDGYYLEVFDLMTETFPRTHRRVITGNLTSPVVYHPEGNAVAVADDLKITLISLVGVPDFTISTYNTPIRFIAFDLTRGVLAAAGGNPDNDEAAMVYLFFLDETTVHPDSTRVQAIAVEDEIIGLQAVNGLFVGTRHSIASIRSFEDDKGIFGWTLEPILTTSNEGITLINQ